MSSWKALASRTIDGLVSHAEMFPWKTVASQNILYIVLTWLVPQAEMRCLPFKARQCKVPRHVFPILDLAGGLGRDVSVE